MAQKLSQPIQSFYPEIPVVNENQIKGGYQVVADKNARNNIPILKREVGMIVSWTDLGVIYTQKYIGIDVTNPNFTNDSNWSLIPDENALQAQNLLMIAYSVAL